MPTVHVNDGNFEKEVVKSSIPVIVDFWAEWCGPCRMIAPVFEDLSNEMQGKVKFAKLNIDENYQTAEKFGVRSIPTLLVLKNGQEAATIVGYMPKPALKEKIERAIK